MNKTIKYFNFAVYWLIILIPFSMAIAPAPMNVFMGLLIFSYILKKTLSRERIIPKTAINIPLFFFFTLACLSIINSVSFKDTFRGGVLRLLSFSSVFLILSCEIKDKEHIKKIVLSCIAGVLLASLDGIWQVSAGKDFIRGYLPVVNFDLVRATASFSDANNLGVYLSALSPLLFGLTLYYLSGAKKAIFIFLSLIVFIGITLTYSRPTLLAICVVLFFLGIVKKDKVLIFALLVLTLISPFLLPNSIKNWAKEMNYNPLRFMCNDDRIAIYRNSLNMIKDHPIRGVGANVFMKNYKKYKEAPEYNNIVTSEYLYAHNNFLHMAAELGLAGLAVFIWLLFNLFKECINIYGRLEDKFFKAVFLSLSACLIAFLVNGLTESSLYSARLALIFWYLMGFSLAIKKFIHSRPESLALKRQG